jgi:putative transposase
MRAKASTGKIRQTYEFIKAHRNRFNVGTISRVLEVAPSGYYAWLQEPVCQRAMEDVRLLRLIRASYAASHVIYGAPRVCSQIRFRCCGSCKRNSTMRWRRSPTR